MPKKPPLQKKISFITINYQSVALLPSCIAAIKKNVPRGWIYDIIVVNNEEHRIAEDLSAHVDTVVELGKNHGYGYANNRGAEIAHSDLICLVNPDVTILSSITPILEQFTDHDADIVAPRLMTIDGAVQEWSAGTEMTVGELLRSHMGRARSKGVWQSREVREADWVSGAALFITKEAFESLRGFDEKFFLYWEDIDLCHRARQRDMRVVYCPDVVVRHAGGASSDDKKQQKRYYDAAQDHYFRKHFHPIVGIFVRLLRAPYRFIK